MAYEEFRKKIVGLQTDLSHFKVEFFDRDSFKAFADNLFYDLRSYPDICITGYFSETVRETLEKLARPKDNHRLRLICQELRENDTRDKKNLQVLRKLVEQGVEIKTNNRLHARILVATFPLISQMQGLLVVGSFDFNTECIGRERYDAGVKTSHPDLVNSAKELFEKIWNDPDSLPLNEKYLKK